MNWIKEHPYLTGGLVLGLLVLFLIFRRSGSASAPPQYQNAGPSEALQATQLQTGAALQAAQISATAHTNEVNAQVAAAQISANRDVTIASLKQQEDLQNIVTSGQVQLHSTDAALASVQAQIGGQVQLADINAGRDVAIANSQADVMKTEYEDATKQQAIISGAATEQTRITADTQKAIADYQFQTQYADIWAKEAETVNAQNRSADIAYTQITTAGDVAKTGIAAQADVTKNAQDVYGDIYSNFLDNQAQQEHDITSLVASGQINKGGAGGQNQVQLLTSVFGHEGMPGAVESSGFNINIPGVGGFGFGGQG